MVQGDTMNSTLDIKNLIYEVRGVPVMFASDIARLYDCKRGTKTIIQAVKRHLERFPSCFYFQITVEEYYNILSITNRNIQEYNFEFYQNLPYVFTEQGIAMLATVLKSKRVEQVSIYIIDAFVKMRTQLTEKNKELELIYNQVQQNRKEIKKLNDFLLNFGKPANEIFFSGQIYDAYSKIVDIMEEASQNLIIIDGYADKSCLDMIKNLKSEVTLITKKNSQLKKLDIEKYNLQYHNLKVIRNNSFHDRYFIIDNNIIYHIGTSINHAGCRTFSINKLEDNILKENLIVHVKEMLLN